MFGTLARAEPEHDREYDGDEHTHRGEAPARRRRRDLVGHDAAFVDGRRLHRLRFGMAFAALTRAVCARDGREGMIGRRPTRQHRRPRLVVVVGSLRSAIERNPDERRCRDRIGLVEREHLAHEVGGRWPAVRILLEHLPDDCLEQRVDTRIGARTPIGGVAVEMLARAMSTPSPSNGSLPVSIS